MFVVIAGTDRPGNHTVKVARQVVSALQAEGAEVHLVELERLPAGVFGAASYAEKPAAIAPHQEAILATEGIVTVVPEYNGSFPGALKYFLDLLQFPESLVDKPAAFVGLSAGMWGGLRAVEQLAMVFQYRKAHIFGNRVFLSRIHERIDATDRLADEEGETRIAELARGFVPWSRRQA